MIIELNASELPIMDGSSKYFVEALKGESKSKMKKVYVVKEVILLMEESGSEILIMPTIGYYYG
jgi:UDP-3-O-[3-hydroxymyristoyl] N-acetylglucosamine deacetylase/3-hydroxyacyl-[acyl-carrier-protein] dehydratase